MPSPKILIPTLLWQRHSLFQIWAKHHKRLSVDVLVCGSERDVSKALAEKHGFHYVEAPNRPLGLKAQLRLEATRRLEWDYLLFLGSDDFITSKTLSYYRAQMKRGYDLIAPLDLYFYARPIDSLKRQLWHSEGYIQQTAPHRVGEPMAVGRALSRDFLERMNFQVWPSVERHIDMPAWRRIQSHVETSHTFRLRDEGLLIFDVKTRENLSDFTERRANISAAPDDYMAEAGTPQSIRGALSRLPG